MKECEKCQADNEDSALYCERCDSPFEQSNTSSVTVKSNSPVLTLTDKKTCREIVINQSCVIGREGDVEAAYFANNMHVSRKHCSVVMDKNDYKIEHLSNVTPTKVNKRDVGRGFKQVIRNGDTLTIADMTFNVSVSIPAPAVPETVSFDTSSQEPAATVAKFIIICPKCGKIYPVKDKNERIKECDECDDYDKEEISKISAEEVTENAS